MGREAQRLVDMRVKLADHTDEYVTSHHASRTTRMPLCRHIFSLRLIQRESCTNTVEDALHRLDGVRPIHCAALAQPTGVNGVAGQNASNMHRLVRKPGIKRGKLLVRRLDCTRQCRNRRSVRIPQIHVADLIQRHILHAATQIALNGLCQRRNNVTTQERTITGERVGDLHADVLRLSDVQREVLVILIADERVAQRFHHAVFGKFIGNLALAQLLSSQTDLTFDRCRRHGDGNLVISDKTRHFLNQIARLVQVGAPTWRRHGKLAVAASCDGATDVGKNVADGVHVRVKSGHTSHFRSLEQDRTAVRDGIEVGRVLARLAIAVPNHQFGGHLGGCRLQLVVHTAFETTGGFGRNLVTACGTRDRHLIEVRGFQQDVLGFGSDLAIHAAHHACDAKHTGAAFAIRGIGDQQILDAQIVILAIQRGELLTFVGATHHDRSFDLIQIVGMHRLSQVEHHVVGDIHCQGDGTHACAGQAATHPIRRMAGRIEALDRASVIAIASNHTVNRIIVVDDHFDVGLGAFRQALGDRRLLVQGDSRIGVGRTGGMMVFARHATV